MSNKKVVRRNDVKDVQELIRKTLLEKQKIPPKPIINSNPLVIANFKRPSLTTIKEKNVRKIRGRKKPQKSYRQPQKVEPNLLLDIPNNTTTHSTIYPTPDWFITTEKADVSVIIPMFKSQHVIKDQIKSWRTENGNIKVETIYVDDCCPFNSKDHVISFWKDQKDRLRGEKVGKIIKTANNSGYGAACNTGAGYATGDYLVFLNADTTVTAHWIEEIIKPFKEDDKMGIVGNLQLKQGGIWDGTIDGAGSEWIWDSMCFVHIGRHCFRNRLITEPFHPNKCPKEVLQAGEREMVTGCCFAIRKEIFKDLGGFNPNYRIGYWEDSELCLSAREEGWKVYFTPSSIIHHKLGHSDAGSHQFHNYNRSYFFNKWVTTGRIDNLIKSKRPTPLPQVSSILIKRRAARGDVLVASAIVPALKKKYPNCNITFSTDCPEVLIGNPFIDKIIRDADSVERQYQLFFNLDMAYENRPSTNILKSYADVVGVKKEDCELFINQIDMGDLPENYIVFHAGRTSWIGRNWSIDKFDELAKKLKNQFKIVTVGSGGDGKITCDLDLREKTNIHQLAKVIARAKLFVGIDSLPMHIAQAVNTPGICFFGCINPETRILKSNMLGVTADKLSCLGCHHRKPIPCVVTSHCETGTLDCENLVTVDNMLNAIEKLISINR